MSLSTWKYICSEGAWVSTHTKEESICVVGRSMYISMSYLIVARPLLWSAEKQWIVFRDMWCLHVFENGRWICALRTHWTKMLIPCDLNKKPKWAFLVMILGNENLDLICYENLDKLSYSNCYWQIQHMFVWSTSMRLHVFHLRAIPFTLHDIAEGNHNTNEDENAWRYMNVRLFKHQCWSIRSLIHTTQLQWEWMQIRFA